MSDEKIRKVEKGVCPKCGGLDLQYGSYAPQETNMERPFDCENCGFSGTEIYSMEFIGMQVEEDFFEDGETVK